MALQEIKLKHPKFGHVIFTNPTSRQVELLEHYKALTEDKIEMDTCYKQ